MIGTQLSHFHLTAKLGEGGMGEVYRAEDSKLGREVAIKVLPEAVASDPERLARFEREAKVLAALNHPNIAAIYSLESADSVHFLVMELVEGEDLTRLIEQGPMPLERALPMALQVVEALEVAHEKGIVHRDLKPANVKVKPDGQVKVLDFGLAKALDPATGVEGSQSVSLSPTLTAQMTQAGVLLGTAAYMAPEQARGETADRRADIWAFGVVLFEMLTGNRVYAGKTVSDTLAGVLAREPEWDELPASLPRSIRSLLERCLEKETRDRLQAIGEARLAIARFLEDPEAETRASVEGVVEAGPGAKRALPWAVAGLMTLAAIVLGVLLGREMRQEGAVLRANLPPPTGTVFHLNSLYPGPAVLAPDGKRLAFSARDEEGTVRLYVRALEATEATVLTGTEGAQYPFWSPDSRHLGFFTQVDATLKKIDVSGGPPVTLCPAEDGKGGSWSEKGVILFSPSSDTPLHRVAAIGGESTPITEIDSERGDNSHRHPRFLPGGEHFLYLARAAAGSSSNVILVRSLAGGDERVLLHSPAAAEYASGYLLFIRERVLMAQPFDLDSLELQQEPFPLAQHLIVEPGAAIAVFSASRTGNLVYQTGDEAGLATELSWIDRSGEVVDSLGDPAAYETVTVSPDGTMAAVGIADAGGDGWDLWIYEIERDLRTRFTFDEATESFPVWSPDSNELVFASNRSGSFDLYRKSLGGTGEVELLLEKETNIFPTSWSPDGEHLLFFEGSQDMSYQLWVLPLTGDREPRLLRGTQFAEGAGVFSPDGRSIAFWSTESGEAEVYLMPFPGPGKIRQISTRTGTWSAWPKDGNELIFARQAGMLVAVQIDGFGDAIEIGEEQEILQLSGVDINGWNFTPAPDGQRILVISGGARSFGDSLELFVNWPEALER